MLSRLFIVSTLCLLIAGCGAEPDSGGTTTASAPETAAPPSSHGSELASGPMGTAGPVEPAPATAPAGELTAAAQEVALTPENTKIQFVGTHVGDDPKPRTGTFGTFQGTAALEGEQLKSVQVDIETASLTTDIDRLTNHLKSPDFFDVNQFPQAKFVSTAVEPAGDGQVTITGDLTLLGTTKSISFPATVSTSDGFKLNAELVIDRTQFGMTFGEGQVVHDVTLTVTAGQ